ncbi:MAG: 30S ribosomal protein S19 [Patescibacteria group bacterium]|jgi:small subunit ribosomal protein S19
MGRSLKKGVYIFPQLLKRVQQALATKSNKPIKTWSRASTITPDMVGLWFEVHNGRTFVKVFATENMVGHRLGEFSLTRKFIKHGGKMQKEQEKAAADASKPKPEPKK